MPHRDSITRHISSLDLSDRTSWGEQKTDAQSAPSQEIAPIQEAPKLPPASHLKKRPSFLSPPKMPAAPPAAKKESDDRDLEANIQKAVLNHLPKEWDEIKHAIEEANERPIDKVALAELFNELDLINVRAVKNGKLKLTAELFQQFEDPSRFARLCTALGIKQENLEQFDRHYLSKWCDALGMRPEDHAAQQKAQRISAFLLQASKLPSTALQYAVVPVIGMVTHDPRNTAYASVALAFANVIINALSYPLMTATSVHLQARNAPSVNLSKEVNYKHRPKTEARKTREKSAEMEKKNRSFMQHLLDLQKEKPALLKLLLGNTEATVENLCEAHLQLNTIDPALATTLKEELGPLLAELEDLYKTGLELIEQCRVLSMTQANVIRQGEGSKHQFWLRVTRPMLSAVPPLFTNAPKPANMDWKANFVIELGAHLFGNLLATPPASHGPKRPGGLSSWQVLLISVGIVIGSMLAQYLFLAPRDQKSKGDAKHKLNMLYGDIFNESGKEKIAAGLPLGPDDFDEEKLMPLLTARAETAVTKAVNATQKELDSLPPDERKKTEAALQAWKKNRAHIVQGHWEDIDEARMVIDKTVGVAQSFSGGNLWKSAVRANYTKSEILDEVIRSFCRSFHFIALGPAAANTMPRAINAIYGGAHQVPLGGYLGILALSLLSAYLGAASEDVSTTYTNIRKKENKEQQPTAWKDVGKGMFAFISKHMENHETNHELERAFSALRAGPFVFAVNVLHPEAAQEEEDLRTEKEKKPTPQPS